MERQDKSVLARYSASLIGISGIFLLVDLAEGAGFQISETTATGLGRAFAGAGVAGDDASDMFYNPAGLMLAQDREFQLGAGVISAQAKFRNAGSSQTIGGATTVPSRGPNADGGEDAVVPDFYYAFPRTGDFRVGLNVNAPFGLSTRYPSGWVGRYHALKSELNTVDINPSVGWAINPQWSAGAGLSAQYADAILSQAVFTGFGSPDGKATVDGNDWGFGFNLGVMYQPSADTHFGLGFRSHVKQEIDGDLAVRLPNGATLPKVGASATLDLPETVYLSGMTRLTDNLELLATARWTNWSRFDELRIRFADGRPDSVTDESWDDTWTLSLGLAYTLNPTWALRAGYAYDQSPVPDSAHRTPRIPDTDRNWLTVGASFRPSPKVSVDFGYAHLFGKDGGIRNTVPIASSAAGVVTDTLAGTVESPRADIIGLQVHYRF